ncbi:hypothetical protein JHK82_014442 [Glycine max]|uniref:Uncharacterized protein n=1 Tax=Glycine max TaxID=3847 RepID=K7KT90_SOYBN|nr:hypothetical protein JHK82_014442 [Glycine max]KAH1124299.1 hypothetical protein GYH30_014160 [Glycine max]
MVTDRHGTGLLYLPLQKQAKIYMATIFGQTNCNSACITSLRNNFSRTCNLTLCTITHLKAETDDQTTGRKKKTKRKIINKA